MKMAVNNVSESCRRKFSDCPLMLKTIASKIMELTTHITIFKGTPTPKHQESAKKPGRHAKITRNFVGKPRRLGVFRTKLLTHTIPRNPEKAIEIMPIVIRAMGPPRRCWGMCGPVILSFIFENEIRTIEKPIPAPRPLDIA